MISLEKIAELSGVSRRTVARALKDKSKVKDSTLAKIEAVLKEYDYEPNLAARYLAAKNQNFKILYMVYRSESSQFHARIFELAKAKAAELRGFGITIDFLVLDHGQADPLGDIKRITADFNYDFLIALPIYEEFFQPYVHALFCKVQELHIPMIFYNMDDTSYKRDCYIGCDYEKSGRIAAGLIALITQSKGKIAILSHRSSRIISFMERVHGFKGELFQKYHDIEIVYTHTMENDYIDVDFDFLREQKVKAIYLVNPGDYSVCPRIREELKGLDVKIITNDLLPISQKYMQDGIISAVITQNEEIQAKKPLDLAFKILVNKEKIDFDKYYTQLGILISQCI
ncbi:LacI family DNA-binding transcriptional regulator [Succinatimonas hippei]|uniref:LacI family DNA-binding transcriptional regulator n=1 Tax=Succinatimonas hippei TaxID=626938 RepID=UPI00248FA954|nr:LacI family DNA-binding transcriptional regulator [Succinatimonas hippei]